MSCQEFQKDLSALLDCERTAVDKERLEEHLKSCKECAFLWRRMNEAQEHVRRISSGLVDEKALTQRVKSRIASRAEAYAPRRGLEAWGRVPVFALIVLIALGMGNYAGRSLMEVLFPVNEEPVAEALLLENGGSFGEIFIDLTSATPEER